MITVFRNIIGQSVVFTISLVKLDRIYFLSFLGYPNVKHFSWDKYLEETNSLPAPARAFKVVR